MQIGFGLGDAYAQPQEPRKGSGNPFTDTLMKQHDELAAHRMSRVEIREILDTFAQAIAEYTKHEISPKVDPARSPMAAERAFSLKWRRSRADSDVVTLLRVTLRGGADIYPLEIIYDYPFQTEAKPGGRTAAANMDEFKERLKAYLSNPTVMQFLYEARCKVEHATPTPRTRGPIDGRVGDIFDPKG